MSQCNRCSVLKVAKLFRTSPNKAKRLIEAFPMSSQSASKILRDHWLTKSSITSAHIAAVKDYCINNQHRSFTSQDIKCYLNQRIPDLPFISMYSIRKILKRYLNMSWKIASIKYLPRAKQEILNHFKECSMIL